MKMINQPVFSVYRLFFPIYHSIFSVFIFLNLKFSKNLNQTNLLSMNQQNQTDFAGFQQYCNPYSMQQQ
jgi:hypothetical protein